MQPVRRPKTLNEKIDDVKSDIKFQSKCIWGVAWIFVLLGAMGTFSGINDSFKSRQEAAFIREFGAEPWGNSNYTNWTIANSTRPKEDRLELIFYDLVREKHLYKSFVSALMFIMGALGLKTLKFAKGIMAMKMFRKYFFVWCTYLIFYCYQRHATKFLWFCVTMLADGTFDHTIYGDDQEGHKREFPSMIPPPSWKTTTFGDDPPVFPNEWPQLMPQVPGQIVIFFVSI